MVLFIGRDPATLTDVFSESLAADFGVQVGLEVTVISVVMTAGLSAGLAHFGR
jgi:hypothetical protein